ncbi:MAG TPA: YceI family protein [Bacteroidales bacterium]|nr:YceI family protein [Bacteroidales bacterium]
MKTNFKPGFLLVLMLTSSILTVAGQPTVVLIPSESKIVISGTSNLHEWEEKLEKFDISMQIQPRGTNIGSIKNVSFSSKSAAVKSDNSIMTGKTHDALQVEKNPDIIFRSSEASVPDSQGSSIKGTLVGDIILNGVTRQIAISYTGVISGDRLEISGSQELNMTDYNIKPPTALMGTLKTGNKVTVTFSLRFRMG